MKQLKAAIALTVAVAPTALAPAPAQAFQGAFAPQELGSLSSVATVEDASALAVNPAALAFQRGSELFLSRSVNGLEQTNLFLTGGGFGTGWQQFRWNNRFLNAYSLGLAADVAGGLSVGGSASFLQFIDTLGGNSANFGLSAMYRPTGWLSAGVSVSNLTSPPVGPGAGGVPETLRRFYRAGLAVRPWSDRLTLSLDGGYSEGDPVSNVTPWLGVQAVPYDGVTLRALIDPQLRYSVGLGFNFGQIATGFMSGVSAGRVGSSDAVYLATSDMASPRRLSLGAQRLAYIRLEGDLADRPFGPFDLRARFYPGALHLTRRIAQAKADPRIAGLVLDLRGVSAGIATIQELREAIEDFKESGKTVVAYVYDADVGEYYLATAANRIVQHPAGTLAVKGLSVTTPFLKGALDKLGVRPQFVAIGKYKSAPEQYTREGYSEPAREQTNALLEAQFAQLVSGIAEARRLTEAEVKAVVEKGMLTPPAAKERNLVDDVAYPDEVPGMVEKGPAPNYALMEEKPLTWAHPDVIAVVSVAGAITRGESGSDLINGAAAGSTTIARALREIRKDGRVKAVVVRVDSPGGDAVAADEIGREIDLLRLAGTPVIVSMGDVAASGGYWVAANGTRVYADPATVTGSIGVFTGQFQISPLLAKLGIRTETLKRGTHADMDSGMRPLSPEETRLLREQARYTYVQFIERVAQGRKLAVSRVDELAQGRVWAGSRAQTIGLVDRLAGLEAAIADARETAGLAPETTALEFYPRPSSLLEILEDSPMEARLDRTVKAIERYQRVNNWLLMPPVESR